MRNCCDPRGVSDGLRLVVYRTLSIGCPSFFSRALCVIVPFFLLILFCFVYVSVLSLELVGVPLIFPYPADHVSDWQPRILLSVVEARSVNVKTTHTHN